MIQETSTTESGEVTASSELIKCPGCDVRLPEADFRAQMEHMDTYHPDVIAERRRGIGSLY